MGGTPCIMRGVLSVRKENERMSDIGDSRPISVGMAPDLVAKNLVSGVKAAEIVAILGRGGWSRDDAVDLVYKVECEVRSARRYAAKRRMWIGAAWCAGGILITVFVVPMAMKGGFLYLPYGAIIYGAFDVIRGLVEWVGNRNPERPSFVSGRPAG